jgi:hypothetical protein
MWSDVILGVVTSGLTALFTWYVALRKLPEQTENSIKNLLTNELGKNGNLSNEHTALSKEHDEIKKAINDIKDSINKNVEYLKDREKEKETIEKYVKKFSFTESNQITSSLKTEIAGLKAELMKAKEQLDELNIDKKQLEVENLELNK